MANPIGVADYQLIVPHEELKKIVAEEVEVFCRKFPLHSIQKLKNHYLKRNDIKKDIYVAR